MDPFLIGGGILALLLLLKGEKKGEVAPELTPAEKKIVYSAPPEVVQQATQATLKVVPISAQLAIRFVPDPSRAGLLFLQRKYPQLNLKYVRMGADSLTVVVSTTDWMQAIELLPRDPGVESIRAAGEKRLD